MSLQTGFWNLEIFTEMPLLHLLLCSLLDTPPKPSPLLDVRVHLSAITPRPLPRELVLISFRCRLRFLLPFLFLFVLAPTRAEQSRRRRPSGRPLPPRINSARHNPLCLALHLRRPSLSPAEPPPRPNRPVRPQPP